MWNKNYAVIQRYVVISARTGQKAEMEETRKQVTENLRENERMAERMKRFWEEKRKKSIHDAATSGPTGAATEEVKEAERKF